MEGYTCPNDKGHFNARVKAEDGVFAKEEASDITNSPVNEIDNGIIPEIENNGNEYIAKILEENNVLMSTLAERNLEVQNLQLMMAKINQQNRQCTQAHSQLLAEVNLVNDRLKIKLAALKETNQELEIIRKTQDLHIVLTTQESERLKKLSKKLKRLIKKNKQMENTTTLETAEQPAENLVESSQLPSHTMTLLPNRKRPKRSQALRIEDGQEDQFTLPLPERPLRRAAAIVYSYKEIRINAKQMR